MLRKILSVFRSKEVGKDEYCPMFIFPESLVAWRAARESNASLHDKNMGQLKMRQMELCKEKPSRHGGDPASELESRRFWRLLSDLDIEIAREEKRHKDALEALEKKLMRAEREKISREGRIVLQTFREVSHQESKWGSHTPAHEVKEERRLVKFGLDYYLCHLESLPVFVKTGGTTQVHDSLPPSSYSSAEEYDFEGEYKSSIVMWVTNSLAQFTDDELKAIIKDKA